MLCVLLVSWYYVVYLILCDADLIKKKDKEYKLMIPNIQEVGELNAVIPNSQEYDYLTTEC